MACVIFPEGYNVGWKGNIEGRKKLEVQGKVKDIVFEATLQFPGSPYEFYFSPKSALTPKGFIDQNEKMLNADSLLIFYKSSYFSEHSGQLMKLTFNISGLSDIKEAAFNYLQAS